MKKSKKDALEIMALSAVAIQLLSILCFRREITIGGEILIPFVIFLIKEVFKTLWNIFTGKKL